MARFMVKASEFKNVCKAVNDRKLAELRKEIIEILKKQDEKDVKKAIDYFNSQEGHYTHLEKSLISGKWIQKAGYGVGTVRIWKGKKYKKIAPGKWARVFDKEGRGTNIAIGKLIARVQKIDNVEDLMAFVMENKQRFVDENGIDLPVLDKLRAAVGVKNENLSGESSSYTYGVGEDVSREKNKIFEDKEKITKEEAELHKVSRKLSQIPTSELKQRKAKLDRWIENKTRNKRESINNAIFKDSYKKEVDAINKELEKRSKGTSKPAEKTDGKYDKELVDSWKDDYKNFSTDALKEKIEEYTKVLERAKNDNPSPDQRVAVKQNEHRLKALNELLEEKKNKPAEKKTKTQEDYEKEYEQSLKGKDDAETLDNIVEAYDKVAKKLRPEAKAKGMNPNELNDPELEALGKLRLVYSEKNISEGEKKYREELEKLSGRMKDAINNEFGYEEESEAEKPSKKEEKQYKETKKMLEDKIAEFDKQLKMFDNNPNENTKRLSKDIEKQKKTHVKMLENLESEYEKTQNRSEAMKGNKNAYKGVSELEKMTPDSLQEYVDEMHNKIMKMDHEDKGLHDAIETWKNAERIRKEKLHAAHELRSDFETKLLNRLQDGIEKQKEACENWNIAEMSDNQLSEYIKVADKWKDKGLVHLADPIIDKWVDSGKDTYDNNDFVGPAMDYQGFAVAHSKAYDKMKKELESRKKAKDEENKPEKTVEETKETPKEEKTEKIYSVDNSGKVVSFDELQPIASNKSVGENEVQLPYSKDLANEIESLKDCVVPKWDNREFMKHVYYEDGKLVTTDARRMKFIEVGELEGIPDGSYVDITTDKSGINIKKLDGMDGYKFPNYKRVIPEDLNQKATLDTKIVKDKIKEMQKDGAIDKKGTNLVQLEFRDGKVFIDNTAVGEAKDIKMKYGEGWGSANEDTNYMNINADYLVNALSGKTSVLQIGERADKAIEINTGSSSSILMPMSGTSEKIDYGNGRQAKKDANEKKSALKEAYKKTNEEFVASIKEHYGDRFKRLSDSAAANLTERMADMSDETLKLNYDRLKFNLDKVMDKKEYITEDTKVDNKLKLGLRDAILYQTTAKEHPEVIERFEEELEKRGITVKKSLFDDFIVDMFVEEDEEEEPEEENESLFNDYSAEQPELFNSTEMMVQEAFNRCNCCL